MVPSLRAWTHLAVGTGLLEHPAEETQTDMLGTLDEAGRGGTSHSQGREGGGWPFFSLENGGEGFPASLQA